MQAFNELKTQYEGKYVCLFWSHTLSSWLASFIFFNLQNDVMDSLRAEICQLSNFRSPIVGIIQINTYSVGLKPH